MEEYLVKKRSQIECMKKDAYIASSVQKRDEIEKKSEVIEKEVHSTREQQHNLIRENDSIMHEVNTIDAQINKVLDIEKENKKMKIKKYKEGQKNGNEKKESQRKTEES